MVATTVKGGMDSRRSLKRPEKARRGVGRVEDDGEDQRRLAAVCTHSAHPSIDNQRSTADVINCWGKPRLAGHVACDQKGSCSTPCPCLAFSSVLPTCTILTISFTSLAFYTYPIHPCPLRPRRVLSNAYPPRPILTFISQSPLDSSAL